VSDKPVVLRERADLDIEEALARYLAEAGQRVAMGFVDALDRAFAHPARHPATGSPRYAHELDLPELRVWPLKRYPYLVFYVERDDHIDVWRILHGERDIPAWLQAPD
jgi:toxin ParE1/3/4